MENNRDIRQLIHKMSKDKDFYGLSNIWKRECIRHGYPYMFTWLGRPIIQIPQDIYAVQELIWSVKPDLIIETGIAHGGSLILSASLLALLDLEECIKNKPESDRFPLKAKRKVIGIDIEIRAHNKKAIQEHFLSNYIEMIEGSSINQNVVQKVYNICSNYRKAMVFLDSNHTSDHVLNELIAYGPCVAKGSYVVVWDTGIEDLPEDFYPDRPWGKGNNPMIAVREFIKLTKRNQVKDKDGTPMKFEIDKLIHQKLVITAAPYGFLKRVK